MISRNRLVIIIITLIGLFFISTIRDGHDWGGDFAQYIHHAKNIAEGNDYVEIGYVENPFEHLVNPPKFTPPVFSFILAPVLKLFEINLFLMKLIVVLLFLFSLYLIYLIFKDFLPSKYIFLLIVMIGLHPYFWEIKDNILSDIPFMFFTYLSFFYIEKIHNRKANLKQTYIPSIALGFLMYLSYGTRNAGIILVLSYLVYYFIVVKKPLMQIIVPTAIFITLYIIQNILIHPDFPQWKYLFNQPIDYLQNFITYIKLHSDLFENGFVRGLRRVSFIFIGGLALLGYITKLRENVTILEIFYPFYFVLLVIWPFTAGLRYVIPLIPLFFFYSAYGLLKLNQRLDLKWKRVTRFIFISIILSAYIPRYAVEDYKPISEGVEIKESIELFDFIKQNSNKNSIILFRKPRVLALYTGRKSSYYYTENDTELWRFLKHSKSSHIIVGPFDDEVMSNFAKENKEYLSLAFSNKDFQFFDILSYKNIIEN